MVELVFAEGRLLEGASELASVDLDARVMSGGREYAIVRTNRHGWHYAVQERDTERLACEFQPHRLLRGGGLRYGPSVVQLRGRPLRPRAWRFTTEAGQAIEATSKLSRSDPFKFTMHLRTEDSLAQVPNSAITLVFGCWLAVNWENAPSGPGAWTAGP